VTGHDDQEQAGESLAEANKDLGEQQFFAGVRAAAEEHRRIGRHAELAQEPRHVEHMVLLQFGGVELQIADHVDGLRIAAKPAQPFGVGFVLAAHATERGEQSAEQKTEALIAAKGSVGEPGIDQERRNAQFLGEPEKVRPDLGFDQHDGFRMNGHDGAFHPGAAIDGVVNLLDVRRQFGVQLTHAGGGGRGDDDLEVGQADLDGGDELSGNVHLADAHRVHPEHVAIGHGLFDLGTEPAEAFAESALPVSAAPHPDKVIRRAEPEKKGEQNIVNDSHAATERQRHLTANSRWRQRESDRTEA
jgi:hypothetical protein